MVEGASLVAILVGLGLLGLFSLLFAVVLLSRRQIRRDAREVVLAAESIAAGGPVRQAEVSEGSPLASVAEAVNRVGASASTRTASAPSATERELREVLDAVRDHAVIATRADGEIRSFSPGACSLFGWTEGEAIGRPAAFLFEEASWRDLLPKLARRSFREKGAASRAEFVRRDGSRFHGHVDVRSLGQADTPAGGWLLVVRDVSAQVHLEQELRDAEERYRSLVEGLTEGVFIVQDGTIVYANPALHALGGHAPGTLPGTPLRDRVTTRDVLVLQDRLGELQARDGATDDLRVSWVDEHRAPVADVRIRAATVRHAGRPAVLALVVDETTSRRIEAELRENEARLDAVLEAASDGLLVMVGGGDGAVVRMTNRAFLEQFGLDERTVLGLRRARLVELLRERGGGAAEAAAVLERELASRTVDVVGLDGERPRVVELERSPLHDRSGRPVGEVLATRDLTDRTAFERRLQADAEELRRSKDAIESSYRRLGELHADLQRRTEELDGLNRELQKLNTMKSDLLANVSHELQTPLVSIRGYTEMILKGRLGAITEEQKRGLSLSLRNVDRLIAMIDNLLAFARLDRSAADLTPTTFPLEPLIEESLGVMRARIEGRHISVTTLLPQPSITVHADRDKILQVFLNLLSNAVKFNREGGSIAIEVEPGEPGFALVRVRDTGVGIAGENLERIFDRFFQAAGEGGQEGTGIGLSIVRTILQLHGCSIAAESEPGRGTTFRFTLPRAGEASVAEQQGTDAPSHGGDGDAPEGTPGDEAPRLRVIRNEPRH